MENKKDFKNAVFEMFEKIADKYEYQYQTQVFIVGGVAIHFYTEYRVSDDLDVILNHRIDIPNDLITYYNDGDREVSLHFDDTYNETLGYMHENFKQDSLRLKLIDGKIDVRLLSPEDLIISKLSRFQEQDVEDIKKLINRVKINKDILFEKIDDIISSSFEFDNKYKKNEIEYKIKDLKDIFQQKELKEKMLNQFEKDDLDTFISLSENEYEDIKEIISTNNDDETFILNIYQYYDDIDDDTMKELVLDYGNSDIEEKLREQYNLNNDDTNDNSYDRGR